MLRIGLSVCTDRRCWLCCGRSHYQCGLAHANGDNHERAVPCFNAALEALEAVPGYDNRVWSNYVHERAKSLQMLNVFQQVRAAVAVCERTANGRHGGMRTHVGAGGLHNGD